MIIALGRDREAEYKENLHKIANVSIARAVNKGWDQTNAYDIIWCQLIFCSAFMPDSGHFFVWCGIKVLVNENFSTLLDFVFLGFLAWVGPKFYFGRKRKSESAF